MKKNVFGRQFKRDHNERKALFKGLMTSLVLHERIETTEEKAKAIKGSVEKLVTKAVKQGAASERLLLPYLHEDAVKKMITDIAPRFMTRPGGYTRIIRIGRRFNDDASMVVIEWVEKPVIRDVAPAKGKGLRAKSKTETTEQSAEIIEATVVAETKDTKKAKTAKKEKPAKAEKVEEEPKKVVKKTTKKESK
jgi:large subunit ribosomal protein L17